MCTMSLNEKLNGVELKFEVKPNQEILELIKSVGYRWSNRQKLWYALQNEKTLQVAEKLTNNKQVTETKVSNTTKSTKRQSKKAFDLWEVTHKEVKELTKDEIKAIGDTKEIAKIIRRELKAFEGIKFSVRTDCNYWGDNINIYIVKSPYDKDSKYINAVLNQVRKLVDSFTYCTNYDPYGDYGSNYNIYPYVQVSYDYIQSSDDVTEIIKAYDIKEEEQKRLDEEERERQFKEYLKEESIRKAEYEKQEAKRQEEIKTIENNVAVKDVDAYYIIGGQWANINKNDKLETYRQFVSEGDFYTRVTEITREIHFDSKTFELFSNQLLSDFTFLTGMGGSKTLDNRIKDIIDYNKMSKEERDTVEWIDCKCVAIYCDNKLMCIINPEGHSYARYVGLVDNVTITKEYTTEQVLSNEEIEKQTRIAETIEDISFNVIVENNIIKTWNTTDWQTYRKAMVNKLQSSNINLDETIIRQIESAGLKEAMYRLIKETDSLQDQFNNADIKEGDKLTLYYIDGLGMLKHYAVTYISHESTTYAQYEDCVKMIMRLPRKRGEYSKTFYKEVLIYKGVIDIPDSLFYSKRVTEQDTVISMGLFNSCDNKQYDVIIDYLKDKGITPIINTYKPII